MDPLRSALGVAQTGGEPVLIFLAGPNGAGKTTFFRAYLEPLGFPFVNADVVARALHAAAPTQASPEIDRAAFAAAEKWRHELLDGRVSFCTETVFSDPKGAKLAFLKEARASGYSVFLVFIGISDSQLSMARVIQRVDAGGHDVPDEKLVERFPRTLANLRAAIPLVDEAFLFDNSSDVEPFRLVAVYSDSVLVERREPIPPWAAGLPEL
jgi:predicted ABC-type ATPase